MLHYLRVGHFEEEDGHVRFVRRAAPGSGFVYVVRRPLDPDLVAEAVRSVDAGVASPAAIPDAWGVRLGADGVLVADEYAHRRESALCVAAVAVRCGADVWANHGQHRRRPEDVIRAWDEHVARVARYWAAKHRSATDGGLSPTSERPTRATDAPEPG